MIKVFEAFAGYGSQSMALRNAGIEYENIGISEVDKYAIVAYNAIHGVDRDIPDWSFERKKEWLESKNIGFDFKKGKSTLKKTEIDSLFLACVRTKNHGDISLVSPASLGDIDLFTYSFPCQDISLAGNGKGLAEGSDTRSGLLWECRKIISANKPRVLLMENVKNLVGKKFKEDFDKWCKELEDLGYENHWQVMNAKDYGIPQNRERVFMISILGGGDFEFPKKEPLELRLKDMLEDQVDEKYYLSKEMLKGLIINENPPKKDNIAIIGHSGSGGQKGYIHDPEGFIGALSATDYKQPKQIAVKQATKKGYTIAEEGDSINFEQPNSKTRRGRVGKGVAQTLTTSCNQGTLEDLRIRKLTPLECFRLMNVSDEDFYKIKQALMDVFYKGQNRCGSQLYKLAGNSIVTECMKRIWANLFKLYKYEKMQRVSVY